MFTMTWDFYPYEITQLVLLNILPSIPRCLMFSLLVLFSQYSCLPDINFPTFTFNFSRSFGISLSKIEYSCFCLLIYTEMLCVWLFTSFIINVSSYSYLIIHFPFCKFNGFFFSPIFAIDPIFFFFSLLDTG